AGLEGRPEATVDDVRRVAPLALAHRRRRHPFEEPGMTPDEVDAALDDPGRAAPGARPPERVATPDRPGPVATLRAPRDVSAGPDGRRSTVEGQRGRLVGDRPPSGPLGSVAVGPTVRAAAAHAAQVTASAGGRSGPDGDGGTLHVGPGDVRQAVREQRAGNLVVVAVDASGSMGAERRMEAAKGAVVSLLLDAYQRRDRVALVTFRGEAADVVLRPTGSVEVARARLAELPTGGRTPLAAGISAALDLAKEAERTGTHRPLIVLVSDGRATAAPDGVDAVEAARQASAAVRRRGIPAVVIDAEDGPTRLGLASDLAERMGARYLTLPELVAGALSSMLT
ncbi:MAG: VWA domain-containing protein, partial [Actinomycetota bacterium]|nr:VWA domain-containing protein [Actinomycetota bacterium]